MLSKSGSYKILIIYIYVVLFGPWVLNLLRVPMSIGMPLLSTFDFLPLIFLLISSPKFKVNSKFIFVDSIKFWVILLFLLVFSMFITMANHGPVVSSIVQFGAIVRYMPLAYFIVKISNKPGIDEDLYNHFKIITFILITITFTSFIIGPQRATIFLPYLPDGATAARSLEINQFSAVFANTIDLSFLLLVMYCILCTKKSLSIVQISILSCIFLTAELLTGSLISLFVLLVISILNITKKNVASRVLLSTIFIAIAGYLVVNNLDIIASEYDNAKLSRIGLLTSTLPEFISQMNVDTFVGIGCDPHVIVEKVNKLPNPIYIMQLDSAIFYLGDVYWVYLTLCYGVIGLCVIVLLFYNIYKSTVSNNYSDYIYSYDRAVKYVFLSVIIISLFNQIIVTKTFSMLFWIYMGYVYSKTKSFKHYNITK